MPIAQELDHIASELVVWHSYDQSVKAELFSTVLKGPAEAFLIDPIPLGSEALADLQATFQIARIFVTNINHARAFPEFAQLLSVPVFVNNVLAGGADFPNAIGTEEGKISPGVTAIAVDGGPAGEMALHFEANGGTLVVGDSLINFDPHGFDFLPAKYCLDPKQMRRSLSKLMDYRFERICFAHGTPILSGARDRLGQLLE